MRLSHFEYENRSFFIDDKLTDIRWIKERQKMVELVSQNLKDGKARLNSAQMGESTKDNVRRAFQVMNDPVGDQFEILVTPAIIVEIHSGGESRQVNLQPPRNHETLKQMAREAITEESPANDKKEPSDFFNAARNENSWHIYFLSTSRSLSWRKKATEDAQAIIQRIVGEETEKLRLAYEGLTSQFMAANPELRNGISGSMIEGDLRDRMILGMIRDLGFPNTPEGKQQASDLLNKSTLSVKEVMLQMSFAKLRGESLGIGTIPLDIGPDR